MEAQGLAYPDRCVFRCRAFPGCAFPGCAFVHCAFPGCAFPGCAFPGCALPGCAFPGCAFAPCAFPGYAFPLVVLAYRAFLDFAQGSYAPEGETVEADPYVAALAKDLLSTEDALLRRLPATSFSYVYDEAAALLGSLLCMNARYVGRMNRNGTLKMARNLFSLQECLTEAAVPVRVLEAHLDRARQLYAVLNCDLEVHLCAHDDAGGNDGPLLTRTTGLGRGPGRRWRRTWPTWGRGTRSASSRRSSASRSAAQRPSGRTRPPTRPSSKRCVLWCRSGAGWER